MIIMIRLKLQSCDALEYYLLKDVMSLITLKLFKKQHQQEQNYPRRFSVFLI